MIGIRSIRHCSGFWMLFMILACASLSFGQEALLSPKVYEVTSAPNVAKTSSDIEVLVEVQQGELPVILSAPHGGTMQIEGVEPRSGAGMETGPSGFFTGRDAGTTELAVAIADAIQRRTGKRPYLVLSKVHRKYLDPNRPASIAYEDSDAALVYQRYHGSLQRFCAEILENHRTGLLLDIHGQGSSSATVYRGTGNGKTVMRLRERFGESAHSGEESLFGVLHRLGWKVHPNPANGKEQSGFTGGYIVQTHGSHRPEGIDAVQLEFGAEYRDKMNRKKTTDVLATAVKEYLDTYVTSTELPLSADEPSVPKK